MITILALLRSDRSRKKGAYYKENFMKMSFMTLSIMSLLLLGSLCHADTIKGKIDKVDIKTYEIYVGGNVINVSKATIFTENDMKVTKNIIVRDLKDHRGEAAVCYGSVNDKDNIFHAYKVKILEGHK